MYTRSNNIKVFPSSNRSKEFISYSGLNTEQNITSLVNRFTRGKSYVLECKLNGYTLEEDLTIEESSYLLPKSTIQINSKINGETLLEDTIYTQKTDLTEEDELKQGSTIGFGSKINSEVIGYVSGKFNICGYNFNIKEEVDIREELNKEGNYLYLRMNTANDVKDNISTLRLDGIDKLLPEEDIENSIYTGLEIINSTTKLSDTNNRKYLQLAERDGEGNWKEINNEVIDTDLFAMDDGIIPVETLTLILNNPQGEITLGIDSDYDSWYIDWGDNTTNKNKSHTYTPTSNNEDKKITVYSGDYIKLKEKILKDENNNSKNIILKEIYIGNLVESLDNNTFIGVGSNLESVDMGDNNKLKILYSGIFKNCNNLTNITLPSNLIEIPNEAFLNCTELTNILFPNTIEKLGYKSFMGCSNIQKIETPVNCNFVDYSCFENCIQLESLIITNEDAYIGPQIIRGCMSLNLLCYPINTNQDNFGYLIKLINTDNYYIPQRIIITKCYDLKQNYFNNYNLYNLSILKYNHLYTNCLKDKTNLYAITIGDGFSYNGIEPLIEDNILYNCYNLKYIQIQYVDYIGRLFGRDSNLSSNYITQLTLTQQIYYTPKSLTYLILYNNNVNIQINTPAFNYINIQGVLFKNGENYNIENTSGLFTNCSNLKLIYDVNLLTQEDKEQIEYMGLFILINPTDYELYLQEISNFSFVNNNFYISSNSNINKLPSWRYLPEYIFGENSQLTNLIINTRTTNLNKNVVYQCNNLNYVKFEDEYNWIVSQNSDMSSSTSLLSSELSNSLTAATYLTATYVDYFWAKQSI